MVLLYYYFIFLIPGILEAANKLEENAELLAMRTENCKIELTVRYQEQERYEQESPKHRNLESS